MPAKAITPIGFIFTFCNNTTHIIKITTRVHFVPTSDIIPVFPQKAVIRIDMPAAAIIATTAGLREFNIPCKAAIFRYFKYSLAITVTIMHDGKIHPNVATNAPRVPAIFVQTNVAEFTAIGPGVIWEIVLKSVNSDILSQ